MLEVKANKSIYFDGEKIDIGENSMRDFLISSLGCPIVLDKSLTLGDFVHVLYDIREFINLYCSEQYEVGRALFSAGKLSEACDYIRIFKTAEVTTDGVLKINTQTEMCSYDEVGKTQSICNLKFVIDTKIVDEDEVLREGVEVKSDFSLLEIIEVLYEDLLYSIKKDNILI